MQDGMRDSKPGVGARNMTARTIGPCPTCGCRDEQLCPNSGECIGCCECRTPDPEEYRCTECGMVGGYAFQPHRATCPRLIRG